MKLTYATWNVPGGGTDAGDTARLRRQMRLLEELSPSVVAFRFTGRRARRLCSVVRGVL